tara:strand:- start:9466 stop:10152 length:687 start_codon:yes stop_codon:yes gene_type:complete
MNQVISTNTKAYEKKFSKGYGTMYPEGHVIRFLYKFLNYEFKLFKGNLLDFGCGNGTHTNYFQSKGFNSFGFDGNEEAIKYAKKRYPEHCENFKTHNALNSILNLFPDFKFNVVVSNQVLYYLDDDNLNNRLIEINELLEEGGYVFFTMMGKSNSNYSSSIPINKDNQELRSLTFEGRLNETKIINFINDEEHLKSKFKIFQPIFTGYYDCTDRSGSGLHYQFIGRKK